MREHPLFRRGVFAGLLAMIGAQGVYWLLTPAGHPDAGAARTIAVWAQVVLGWGGAVWLAWKPRARSGAARDR